MFSSFSYHDGANTDACPFYFILNYVQFLSFKMLKVGLPGESFVVLFPPKNFTFCCSSLCTGNSLAFPFHFYFVVSTCAHFYLTVSTRFSCRIVVGAVKNALSRDGLDPGIMDLDPEKSLKSQQGGGDEEETEEADTGPPLKDDPTYQK